MSKAPTPRYYVVDGCAMPDVLLKVVETTNLLDAGKCSSVSEAVKVTGISRSAYYKYKNHVHPFFEATRDKIITIYTLLRDEPGVLSEVLNTLSKAGANIITINQSIPVDASAVVTITLQTGSLKIKLDALLERMRAKRDVIRAEIMAG